MNDDIDKFDESALEKYSDNLPKKVKPGWIKNIFKSSGLFFLSKAEPTWEVLKRYKILEGSAEGLKELARDEIKNYGVIKHKLQETYYSTHDPVEKFKIRKNLDELEKYFRHFQTTIHAVKFLPEADEEIDGADQEKEISLSWLDRFMDYSRKNNEPWREELLTRALAEESKNPGTISNRAIFIIGTLDEATFHAFASLLDASAYVDGEPYILGQISSLYSMFIPHYLEDENPNYLNGDNIMIGRLMFLLDDSGLTVGSNAGEEFIKNQSFSIEYGDFKKVFNCLSDVRVTGITVSTLGSEIQKLYDPKSNAVGEQILDDYLNTLSDVVEIVNPESISSK